MKPILWHIPVSHYSEKARWALAWKGVEHERRAPPPGAHMAIALWLTRGAQKTFPVLELDGGTVGDSTAIIAALEEYRPEPRLYPEDPGARARALELEQFFDEELGPHIRLLAWHELRKHPELMAEVAEAGLPALPRSPAVRAGAGRFASGFVQLRYRVAGEDAADAAREKVVAALDRLDAELELAGGEYLVGDSFSVADLTAAALFYPLVGPPGAPPIPQPPGGYAGFRAGLAARPGYGWVAEIYRRHRKPAR